MGWCLELENRVGLVAVVIIGTWSVNTGLGFQRKRIVSC